MKIIKKISYVLLTILLLSSQVMISDFQEEAEAKSLKDLRAELQELYQKQKENQDKQEATEEEIEETNEEIAKLTKEKEEIRSQIRDLEAEIEQLNKDIEAKNKEIQDIISYYQITSSNPNMYLEYVLTATDLTDMIYRAAVAEQLSDYNDSLIEEYEDLIRENEKKSEELVNQNVKLDAKTKELEKELSKLSIELKGTVEGALSIEEEISVAENTIKQYEKTYEAFKCDEKMDYKACLESNKDVLPPDTAFYRPVVSGYISSGYGPRTYKLNGKWKSDFHYGLDFATSHGSKIYAVAAGRVVAIVNAKALYSQNKKKICGGTKVYIIHTVNGKKYTSTYMHMASYSVKVGDVVTKDTVIGKVGGSPSIEYWDNCSTGAHAHLMMSTGHYTIDYTSSSTLTSRSFDPHEVVNAPKEGGSFKNRTTKY